MNGEDPRQNPEFAKMIEQIQAQDFFVPVAVSPIILPYRQAADALLAQYPAEIPEEVASRSVRSLIMHHGL
jgi:hypothetical protein